MKRIAETTVGETLEVILPYTNEDISSVKYISVNFSGYTYVRKLVQYMRYTKDIDYIIYVPGVDEFRCSMELNIAQGFEIPAIPVNEEFIFTPEELQSKNKCEERTI